MITNNHPRVIYKKKVSDAALHYFLASIAETIGHNIIVHSGDRDFRPAGSPSKSLHLKHQAADVHVEGMKDEIFFYKLIAMKEKIADAAHSFQIIKHGKFTATEGPHVHIGNYGFLKAELKGPGIAFFTEGSTEKEKGHYILVK